MNMPALKNKLSRRDFIKLASHWLVRGGLAMAGGWYYVSQWEPAWIEVTQLTLTLPRLPKSFSGMRLVQVSDLHIGEWMTPERLSSVVDLTLTLDPDLIAVTGDFASYYQRELFEPYRPACAAALKRLSQKTLTLAVMGNHDHWMDVNAVRLLLAEARIRELPNSVISVGQGADALHLCGVDDIWHQNDDLDAVMNLLPPSGCAIVLAHSPDYADRTAPTGRFDLQISGHSHGGQLIIPLLGPIILPPGGRKYPLGLYKLNEMYQYTNRGVGVGFLPYRFNCRPEITVFTLLSPA